VAVGASLVARPVYLAAESSAYRLQKEAGADTRQPGPTPALLPSD
jgi:hypothetical protein